METEQYTQHIQACTNAELARYVERDVDTDGPITDLLQRLAIAELDRRAR